MKLKKIIAIISALAITISSVPAFAAFNDVPSDAGYMKSLDRVSSLGIISGTGDGSFSPYDSVSREQFATMIVKAAGLTDKADALKGSSIFIDVDPYGWSSGYINAAVGKGLITGMPDNRFYPESGITLAQACTILIKALGYTDSDLQGTWPKNYIEKAKTLGIATGVNIGTNEYLPRWAAAVMIDNLLDTQMKTATANATATTFAKSTGVYVDAFIFANSQTNSKLLSNQVQTDTGIYYVPDGMKLNLGVKYRFVVNGDKILYSYNTNDKVLNISVDSIIDNKVSYKNNGTAENITLPDKTTYYYQGNKLTYENAIKAVQTKSSIVMIYDEDNVGFEYALIFDPVVSKPYVVQGVGADAKIPAEYKTENGTFIAKGTVNGVSIDGKTMTLQDIDQYDVLYSVTDIWGNNKHVLLIRDKVNGTINSILPDKVSPNKITVDSKEYDLSVYFSANKLNTSSGAFRINDVVKLILGNDGKVVDIYYKDFGDNSYYAVILDSSYYVSESKDSAGKILYKVTLLHADGTTQTYNISNNMAEYKGRLVKYQPLGDNRISIADEDIIDFMDTSVMGDHNFAIDERKLDGDYIADNAVIFNIISNASGAAAKAEVLDLDQIPRGKYLPKKIIYISKSGMFNDINLLVTDDILDNQTRLGVVTAVSGGGQNKTYTMLIDGTSYSYTGINIPTVVAGSMLKINMQNSKITSIIDTITAIDKGRKVDAIDSKRIKMNGTIYWFSNTASVYLKDETGNIKLIGTEDVDLSLNYTNVDIFYDKDIGYGGKVAAVVLTE